MINRNFLSREDLINLIKKSPRTPDGFYYFPKFTQMAKIPGEIIDKNFYYSRDLFYNKKVFSNEDIQMFLSKEKSNYDLDLFIFIKNKINDIIGNCYEYCELKDKIPSMNYTLGELIDCALFVLMKKFDTDNDD